MMHKIKINKIKMQDKKKKKNMILENKMQDVKQIWCWKINKENKKCKGIK